MFIEFPDDVIIFSIMSTTPEGILTAHNYVLVFMSDFNRDFFVQAILKFFKQKYIKTCNMNKLCVKPLLLSPFLKINTVLFTQSLS